MQRRSKASTKPNKGKSSSPRTVENGTDDSSLPRSAVLGMMLVLGLLFLVTTGSRELPNVRKGADTHVDVAAAGAPPVPPPPPEEKGALIRFTVSNLDGKAGRTGTILVRTRPSWGPLGAERLEALVAASFWTDCRFFRVLPNFVAQFGINGTPDVQKTWRTRSLVDEPLVTSNTRGTITFATSGKNTRTTQLFINLVHNKYLDDQGFTPIAEVVGVGMTVVDRIYQGYKGDPNQGAIQNRGNAYLESDFPKLTFISKAEFVDNTDDD